jgi:hypothetical protein
MRPDQRRISQQPLPAGSRSGSVEAALAGQQTGVPPFVPALSAFTALQVNALSSPFRLGTMPAAGRIWTVILSYFTATDATYSAGVTLTFAAVQATVAALTLAAVELGASGPGQGHPGQCDISFNGLPVASGEQLVLNINGGITVTDLFQRASAVVLFSVP